MELKIPHSHTPLHGNDRYQGYIVDFIKKLSEEVGFKYILRVVKDGSYGDKSFDGTWNGMIGEVLRQVSGLLRAARFGQGNVFTGVCLFTEGSA